MNVLFITGDYPPIGGGIAIYCVVVPEHLEALAEVDKVSVLALGDWSPERKQLGPKHFLIRERVRNFFELGWKIFKTVLKERPDAIHLVTLFPEGLWAGLAARLIGKPLIIMLHGLELTPWAGSRKTRLVKRLGLKLATGFVTNSNPTKARAVRLYEIDPKVIKVVHMGLMTPPGPLLDGDPDRSSLGIDADEKVVLSLGRQVAHKGFADLIRAVALAKEKVRLVIVGEGPEKVEFEALARELGVAERVVFPGRVERVEPYYRLADIFVLASYEDKATGAAEGFGNVLVEAQVREIPVIGTDSGGIPDAFQPDLTGLLVPPQDPAALAEAIDKLAGDDELRRKLSAAGPDLVAERYVWTKNVLDYLACYQDAQSGRGSLNW